MPFAYPNNVVRIMSPQMNRLKGIVSYHFKRRHDSEMRKSAVINWVSEFRRVDKASGFSTALNQIGQKGYRQA